MLTKDDFRIEAYVQHTKVDIRDLLHGFSCTVTRYSAIDNVLDRLRNTPVNVGVELKYLESKVLELTIELESIDVRHRQITFTGKQLMALSRGKLKLPRINLYDLSQYYYAFFKSRNRKCCTKIILEAFKQIYSFTGYDFENVDRINRRLCNSFFKAFVKKASDNVKAEDIRDTKRRRLSSK